MSAALQSDRDAGAGDPQAFRTPVSSRGEPRVDVDRASSLAAELEGQALIDKVARERDPLARR